MSRTTAEKPNQAAQQPPPRQAQQTAVAGMQMTRRQSACLNRQLRERGLSQTETETWLCQAVNTDSVAELTKRQASALIECLFRMTDPVPIRQENGGQHD